MRNSGSYIDSAVGAMERRPAERGRVENWIRAVEEEGRNQTAGADKHRMREGVGVRRYEEVNRPGGLERCCGVWRSKRSLHSCGEREG